MADPFSPPSDRPPGSRCGSSSCGQERPVASSSQPGCCSVREPSVRAKGDRRISLRGRAGDGDYVDVPRRARLVLPGVAHHLTQRGNNRQRVFFQADDYLRYLGLLGRNASRCGTRILAYCLMPNHVHLVALPESAQSFALTLGRAHCEYALALNRAAMCGRTGSSPVSWRNRTCCGLCATSNGTQCAAGLRERQGSCHGQARALM